MHFTKSLEVEIYFPNDAVRRKVLRNNRNVQNLTREFKCRLLVTQLCNGERRTDHRNTESIHCHYTATSHNKLGINKS